MSQKSENKPTSANSSSANDAPDKDVHRLKLGEREFILVGTAHISQKSTELVRKVIEDEKPDCVCVELDERRYESISDPERWKKLNLLEVIKKKQIPTLVVQLALASYQKRLGDKLGVLPGTELLEATKVAKENNIPFALCDREVGITLKRAWRRTGFFKKLMLLNSILASMFDKTEITEEQIQEIKDQDALTEMLNEIGEAMPQMKSVLIDERDQYLATKIKEAKGKKIVAVVGAGHVQGMIEHLKQESVPDLKPLEEIPPASNVIKAIGVAIPLLIIGSIAWIGYAKGGDEAVDNLKFWALINGIPCGIGAILALAHPVTIIVAFIAAPITSLTPVIGAGYVTAFVQAWLVPPRVEELHSVGQDMSKFTGWWKNRLLKVFLAFFLPSLGSVIGTYVGGYEIFKNLVN